MKVSVNNILSWCVLIGLWSSLILPNVFVGGIALFLTTPISIIVLILAAYMVYFKQSLRVDSLLLVLLMLCFVIIFSTLFSWVKNLSPISYRDLIEIVKYAQFMPYVLVIPFLKKDFIKGFQLSSKIAAVFFMLVGLLQLLNIHVLTYLYLGSSSYHLDSVLSGERITITGSDPNTAGAVAAFFAFLSLSYFLFTKNKIWVAAFLACFTLMLLTQSRTVLVSFIFSSFVFVMFFYKLSFIIKIPLLIILLGLAVLIFKNLSLEYITIGFQTAVGGDNPSLNVRLDNLVFAFETFKVNPLLGIGPSKGSLSTVMDSEYALIMQRYGMSGILVFLLLIILLFKAAIDNILFINAKILLLFMMMTPFIMLTNNVFSGYQLMSAPVMLYMVLKVQRKEYEFSNHRSYIGPRT